MPSSASTFSSNPQPRGVFLAATSLTSLKPVFKSALHPLTARLAAAGVIANQITLASLIGSIGVSAFLCAASSYPAVFAILPMWLVIRMACAAIDGTLAIEFGQKSRVGGVLNEVGDIISDAALFWPLAFVRSLSFTPVLFLIVLIACTEIVGILSAMLGRGRRLEGPLGKADRTIVLAIIALIVATLGHLPGAITVVVPAFAAGLALTIWNRLLFALRSLPKDNLHE